MLLTTLSLTLIKPSRTFNPNPRRCFHASISSTLPPDNFVDLFGNHIPIKV